MSDLPMIRSLPGYPWLPEAEAARRDKARIAELEAQVHQRALQMARDAERIAELEAALRPFTKLKKVEQVRTAVIAEDDLITVVVRVGDIEAALAALSGEGVT